MPFVYLPFFNTRDPPPFASFLEGGFQSQHQRKSSCPPLPPSRCNSDGFRVPKGAKKRGGEEKRKEMAIVFWRLRLQSSQVVVVVETVTVAYFANLAARDAK